MSSLGDQVGAWLRGGVLTHPWAPGRHHRWVMRKPGGDEENQRISALLKGFSHCILLLPWGSMALMRPYPPHFPEGLHSRLQISLFVNTGKIFCKKIKNWTGQINTSGRWNQASGCQLETSNLIQPTHITCQMIIFNKQLLDSNRALSPRPGKRLAYDYTTSEGQSWTHCMKVKCSTCVVSVLVWQENKNSAKRPSLMNRSN